MSSAFLGQNRGISRPTRVAHLDRKPGPEGRSAILLEADRQGCASVRSLQRATAGSPGLRDASGLAPDALDQEAAESARSVGLGPIPPTRSALDEWANGRCLPLNDAGRDLHRQPVVCFLRNLWGTRTAGNALTVPLTITQTPARDRANRVATSRGGLTVANRPRDLPAGNRLHNRGDAR